MIIKLMDLCDNKIGGQLNESAWSGYTNSNQIQNNALQVKRKKNLVNPERKK
jgi:hypothetical protein